MALHAAFLFAFLQHVDGHGMMDWPPTRYGNTSGNPGDSGGIHYEHVLLQRGRQVVRQSDRALGPDMVNDESGFEGGDEIGEIADSSCASADVRRRRRAEAMCSCRAVIRANDMMEAGFVKTTRWYRSCRDTLTRCGLRSLTTSA